MKYSIGLLICMFSITSFSFVLPKGKYDIGEIYQNDRTIQTKYLLLKEDNRTINVCELDSIHLVINNSKLIKDCVKITFYKNAGYTYKSLGFTISLT